MDKKLEEQINNLEAVLLEAGKIDNPVIANASVSKCFEIAMEHAWKFFKRKAADSGLEAYSPKDAARTAAATGLIDDPELWIRFINNRNLSIHDYLRIDDREYLESIKQFLAECKRLKGKW